MKEEAVIQGIPLETAKEHLSREMEERCTKRIRSVYLAEWVSEKFLCVSAMTAVLCVLLITTFIFTMGLPAILQIGVGDFIFGTEWYPEANIFGIFSMLLASLYVTFFAVLIGVPIGLLTAVFMTEYAPKPVLRLMNPAVALLAGIPSVVFGFFGLVVIVPMINQYFGGRGAGNSLLAASLILGVMILPTIVSTASTALRAAPVKYRDGAYALGASKMDMILQVLFPAAKSGILSGIVLGVGRAVGETMAVILVAGNANIIPGSVTDPVRTLTANIAIEMGYSYGLHQEALFAAGVILFFMIMGLNLLLHFVSKGKGETV